MAVSTVLPNRWAYNTLRTRASVAIGASAAVSVNLGGWGYDQAWVDCAAWFRSAGTGNVTVRYYQYTDASTRRRTATGSAVLTRVASSQVVTQFSTGNRPYLYLVASNANQSTVGFQVLLAGRRTAAFTT